MAKVAGTFVLRVFTRKDAHGATSSATRKHAQMPLRGSGSNENGRLARMVPIIACPAPAIF
jgi:hypothetical protein